MNNCTESNQVGQERKPAKVKHSPLPWKASRRADYNDQWSHYIDAPCDPVALVVASAESDANAEYLVRACNSHADLLDACKTMVDRLGDGIPSSALAHINAVISRAEGGIT